jgi:hypothetical protein
MAMVIQAASANNLIGSWSGTLSAGEYKVSANVSFTKSGYTISAAGISSSGGYKLSGKKITLSPSSPSGFSPATMSILFDGDRCTISGKVLGIKGTLSLNRKESAATPKPTSASPQLDPGTSPVQQREDTATPHPTASVGSLPGVSQGIALQPLLGRWIIVTEDATLTLAIYADGWVALYLGGIEEIENGLAPLIYGPAEWTNGILVIRQDGIDPVSAVTMSLSELLSQKELQPGPVAVALPIGLDPSGQLVYAEGEARLPFTPENDPAKMYDIHPDRP